MRKSDTGFFYVFVLSLLLAAAASHAEVPDTNPRIFGLDEMWPSGGLNAQHPPFIYDANPDNVASKATFKTITCLGTGCHHASAFFIETERDDDKVCAITAGHVVEDIFYEWADVSDEEERGGTPKDWEYLPGRTVIALNYRRLQPGDQQVAFFGNVMPSKSIQVVQYFYDDPVFQSQEQGRHKDIALLLIDTSRMKGRTTTSMLPYSYVAEGSLPTGRLVVKGHPNGWPLHRNESFLTSAVPGRFSFIASLHGELAKGASGGPWVHGEEEGVAFAATSCIGKCQTASRPDGDVVLGSFLTPLKTDIEETCKQSKTPKYVYIASTIVPMAAFENGFIPPGNNRDVVAHVSGASCRGGGADTAFISTTKNQAVAYERAQAYASAYPGKEVYVYRIRADEKFYHAKDSLRDSLKHFEKASASVLTSSKATLENEYLFVDDVTFKGIPSENIASALLFKKERDGTIRHQQLSNTNFMQANTKASTFTYVGPESPATKMNMTWMTKVGVSAPNGSCLMPDSIPEDARHFPAEVLLNIHLLNEL